MLKEIKDLTEWKDISCSQIRRLNTVKMANESTDLMPSASTFKLMGLAWQSNC